MDRASTLPRLERLEANTLLIFFNDEIVVKLRKLPEPLVHEVNDFVDFLLARHDTMLAESDFFDYLPNLEDYEERLARGEIKW